MSPRLLACVPYLLALVADCEIVNPSRIRLADLKQDALEISFELTNDYSSPITFMQVRLFAVCPNGPVEAGGFSDEALHIMAAGTATLELGILSSGLPLNPGDRIPITAVPNRVFAVPGVPCNTATLKDVTVLFADGTGAGDPELMHQQWMHRRYLKDALGKWMETIHDLANAADPVRALKEFRARLNDVDDDCGVRPLETSELVACQLAFGLHGSVNTRLQRIQASGPDSAALARLVDYWENLYKLLLTSSEPKQP